MVQQKVALNLQNFLEKKWIGFRKRVFMKNESDILRTAYYNPISY